MPSSPSWRSGNEGDACILGVACSPRGRAPGLVSEGVSAGVSSPSYATSGSRLTAHKRSRSLPPSLEALPHGRGVAEGAEASSGAPAACDVSKRLGEGGHDRDGLQHSQGQDEGTTREGGLDQEALEGSNDNSRPKLTSDDDEADEVLSTSSKPSKTEFLPGKVKHDPKAQAQALDASFTGSNFEEQYVSGMSSYVGSKSADNADVPATCEWTKERSGTAPGESERGAMQVNEQAPQLNRRFFRGRDRIIRQARVRRRQLSPGGAVGEGEDREGRRSNFARFINNSFLVTATLVEEDECEVVMAEPISFFERKWKRLALGIFVFLAVLVVSCLVLLLNNRANATKELVLVMSSSDVPSVQPSAPPSFDRRPTLEIVQARGHVRCGLRIQAIESGGGDHMDLCRSIAAVLFGGPDNIEGIPVTPSTRFEHLNDRKVDLLLSGDTHTVEREVRERSTGVGFAFSSPYYYDGMAYFGDQLFVGCAESRKRFNECSSLNVCVNMGSTGHDFVRSSFPSDYFTVGTSHEEMTQMLMNDTCNVIASDRSNLLRIATSATIMDRNFVLGTKLKTKEPLAIVARNDDREFSDIINWVMQSLFYGEEQGLTKDLSRCQIYSNLTASVADLNFLNAIYCVGNYGEIVDDDKHRGMNQINNGTSGMLYAIPFGQMEQDDSVLGDNGITGSGARISRIRNEGLLRCGVTVPDGLFGFSTSQDKLVGMSIEYCRAIAAALFNGNYEAVEVLNLTEKTSFVALDNGTIDVLAGARVERKYDFRSFTPDLRGFRFSTPYFHGNETAIVVSLATREFDALFSSFVNCVILATISAEEKIKRKESIEMPFASIFGSELNWALRDSVEYSGSYDKMYMKYFGDVAEEGRARNTLNDESTPQIHSLPGIYP